jgi:hypothetical protein
MKIGSKGSAAAPRLQPDFVRYPGLAKPHPGLNSDRCSAAKSVLPVLTHQLFIYRSLDQPLPQ